jgi:hypothetical protein
MTDGEGKDKIIAPGGEKTRLCFPPQYFAIFKNPPSFKAVMKDLCWTGTTAAVSPGDLSGAKPCAGRPVLVEEGGTKGAYPFLSV